MVIRVRVVGFVVDIGVGVIVVVVEVEVVALAGEPELAVVFLVVDDVDQVGEHFAAISTDQNIRATCKIEKQTNRKNRIA